MAQDNNALHELLVDELKDLYSAERQIVSALPKMAKKAMHNQLRAAFERHFDETKGHVTRLERIADELDFSLRGKKCKGMEGLVDEGQDVISDFDNEFSFDGLRFWMFRFRVRWFRCRSCAWRGWWRWRIRMCFAA